ncbi:hypothetical protein GON09_005166 [Rhodococcus sp. B50]|nr:hypothetical protein [Rhodococcus sp. B50]
MRTGRLILPAFRMVLQYREDGKNLVAAEDTLDILYEAESSEATDTRRHHEHPHTGDHRRQCGPTGTRTVTVGTAMR